MSTKHKLLTVLLLTFSLFIAFPGSAAAQWRDECVGFGDVPTLQGLTCLFENVLSIALRLIGIGMFLMIVISGFKLLTASGDPKKADAAKSTLTMAVVGLVMAILAWFILALITQTTGVNVTEFRFPLITPAP